MFRDLVAPPADPILGLAQLLARDTSSDKVDLGIGIYMDEKGEATVLKAVKAAERWLLETQRSKRYLSPIGNPDYNDHIRALLFGAGSNGFERSRTIQTPGGTGALRLAVELLRALRPKGRVFVPSPTWTNHGAILAASGQAAISYPYYDKASGELRFDAMMAALAGLGPDDALLLHGCCHNPSGADLSLAQWGEVADLLEKTGALPLVDLAYIGFADGLEDDVRGLRLLVDRLPELLVATSCSKNFALYRERVGALTSVGASARDAELARAHVVSIVRPIYSMPPDHGAAIVAHILDDSELRATWERELAGMRTRLNDVRAAFADHLTRLSARDYSFLAHQRGMFALLDVTPQQVERLRAEHHVHMIGSGRINVAGLSDRNIERVAGAIADVLA